MADLPSNLTPAQFTAATGSAPTPTLTQAQLNAQNNANGISQTQYNPTAAIGGALNSSTLANSGSITVPPAPAGTDASGALASGNAMITANGIGSSSTTSSSLNPQMNSSLEALLAEINNKPPSASDQYATDYAASGIDAKQTQANTDTQAYNDATGKFQGISAQIAGLNAQAEAAKAQVGGTPGLASFQDAQVSQISRSAALQALPLQAQAIAAQAEAAAAQGKAALSQQILQQAQQHLDTIYQIHQQDATAQYNYKSQLLKSVYDYATASEKNKLDAQQKANDQAFTTQQNQLNYAQSLSTTAIANGAPSIAASISALDPKSATYAQDVASYAAKIPQKANLQFVSGTANQASGIFDQNTGKFSSNGGGNGYIAGTPITTSQGTVNVPASLEPYVQTFYDGTVYADLSSLTPTDKTKQAQAAVANGIKPILDAATASKLNAISVSKTNLANIGDSLTSQNIVNDKSAPFLQGIGNSVSSFFGNSDIKSFNAWRTAVINNVQALAGGQGSGLRINQAEIDAALKNDLPVITGVNADNLATANAKIAKLNSQLDSWSKQLLGGGNTAAAHVPPIGTVINSGGKQYHVIDAQGNLAPL